MNMKFKHFALILAFLGFSSSLFAEPVTYSFSSFGGGLPSSAARVSMAASDSSTQQRIIVEDEEDDNYNYDYSDEPTVKKNKKTGLIITYVVIGVVVTAGIIVGAYYLTNESANCCSTLTDNFLEGCGEGCGEACGASMEDACASSINESCSSSTGSTTSCTSKSMGDILVNGLQLIPIYVP